MARKAPETESEALVRRTREAREAIQDLKTVIQEARQAIHACEEAHARMTRRLEDATETINAAHLEHLKEILNEAAAAITAQMRERLLEQTVKGEIRQMVRAAFDLRMREIEDEHGRGYDLEVTEDRRLLGG